MDVRMAGNHKNLVTKMGDLNCILSVDSPYQWPFFTLNLLSLMHITISFFLMDVRHETLDAFGWAWCGVQDTVGGGIFPHLQVKHSVTHFRHTAPPVLL